jgi:hypothetical protein
VSAARSRSDSRSPGEPWAPNLQENTESQDGMVHHHLTSPPSATISFSEIMLDLLKNLILVNFFYSHRLFSQMRRALFSPKLSDFLIISLDIGAQFRS